jgi:hypothetical protein
MFPITKFSKYLGTGQFTATDQGLEDESYQREWDARLISPVYNQDIWVSGSASRSSFKGCRQLANADQ